MRAFPITLLAALALAMLANCSAGERNAETAGEDAAMVEASPPPPPPPPPVMPEVRPPPPLPRAPPPSGGSATRPPTSANGGSHATPGRLGGQHRDRAETLEAELARGRFPCRVPRFSSHRALEPALTRDVFAGGSLGAAADRLRRIARAAGYDEPGYYETCGGFVMVAQLEAIEADGTPSRRGRFPALDAGERRVRFSLNPFLSAPPGRYRVIALRVSDQPLEIDAARVLTREEARTVIDRAAPELATATARIRFANQRITAIVWEYVKRAGQPAALVERSANPTQALIHLRKAGIEAGLVRPPAP